MLVAFWAVLPVFLIIGMGVFLRARDLLPDSAGKVLGLYVLKLALPLLLLHVMAQADRGTLAHGGFWLGALGAPLGCYALGYLADWAAAPAIRLLWACPSWKAFFPAIPRRWWWRAS